MANVHVAAAQGSAGIVFKHEIKEGPASKSYGIAVAQLAGVPAPVVRRARGFLAKLEAQANAQTSSLPDLLPNRCCPPKTMPGNPIRLTLLSKANRLPRIWQESHSRTICCRLTLTI